MNGQEYPARRDKIAHALDAVGMGRKVTLEGSILMPDAQWLRLIREPAAAARAPAAPLDAQGRAEWDGRWSVEVAAPDAGRNCAPWVTTPSMRSTGARPVWALTRPPLCPRFGRASG
ncbi:hypothetical protein QWZ10_12390 [Paracoccus cavernae]|uniref:Uncharacterized protein n=1 Tax=Paracoccus cavernae TaxID=1571207 RepID=A0ABT8D6E2_9RHOB|nr:hypothetical protein [Paracoccus cavernae]